MPGFHALCVPGALFFDDVWVYFAFILNWTAADVSDPVTCAGFLDATAKALQLVKDSLAAPVPPRIRRRSSQLPGSGLLDDLAHSQPLPVS